MRARWRKRTSGCEGVRKRTGIEYEHVSEQEEKGKQTEKMVPEGSNVLGGEEDKEQRKRVDEDGKNERADNAGGGERGRDAWNLRDHQQRPGVDEESEEVEENETVAPARAKDSVVVGENGAGHAGDCVEDLE